MSLGNLYFYGFAIVAGKFAEQGFGYGGGVGAGFGKAGIVADGQSGAAFPDDRAACGVADHHPDIGGLHFALPAAQIDPEPEAHAAPVRAGRSAYPHADRAAPFGGLRESARDTDLRNLGGIIIVDFIDMDNEEHKTAVLSELNKALDKDRTKITVSNFTSLGLVEITRKRTRESLAHVLCEPCPTCQGRGEIKTAQTICYEILREILREARQFNAKEYRILASQSVIDMFLDEESANLAQLADFIKKPIYLQVETAYTQEQFDVVLV